MKKLLFCLVIVLISMASLFALQGKVTWTWYENDPDVLFYRYQLDSQNDDGWTVVDRDVNEVTLLIDVSQVHSLYLQQSYDGVIWSQSSVVESEIFTDFGRNNDEVFEEDIFPEAEQSEQAVAEEGPKEEQAEASLEQVSAQSAEKTETYTPFMALDYGFGYLNTIPDSAGPKTAGAFVAYSIPFINAGVLKVGFKANLAIYASKELFTRLSEVSAVSYLNILALGLLNIGNGDVYMALGPDAGFNLFSDYSYRVGLSMELGVRYHSSSKMTFGIAVADHQYLFPSDKVENRFDVRVFMGSVF